MLEISDRDALNKFRDYRKKVFLKENDERENQLTPQEVEAEQKEFRESVSGIVSFNTITKTGENFVFIRGQMKLGDNTLDFSFKLEECTIATQNLKLSDENFEVVTQLYSYHKTWVSKWQNLISGNKTV